MSDWMLYTDERPWPVGVDVMELLTSVKAERDAALARCAALAKYASHRQDCHRCEDYRARLAPLRDCNCGLAALLADTQEVGP